MMTSKRIDTVIIHLFMGGNVKRFIAVVVAVFSFFAVSRAQTYDVLVGLSFPTNRHVGLYSAPALYARVGLPKMGRHMSLAGAFSVGVHNPVQTVARSTIIANPQVGINGEWNLPVVGDHRIGAFLSVGYLYASYSNTLAKTQSWSVSWNAVSYICFENIYLVQMGITFTEPYLPISGPQTKFVLFGAGIGMRF